MNGEMRIAHKIVYLKGRDYLGDQDTDSRVMLKSILQKQGVRGWNWFIWLRKGFSGGPLWTW